MINLPQRWVKHFNELFDVSNTEIGIKISPKMKVEIGELSLDENKIEFNNPELQNLFGKYLIGIYLPMTSTFRVEFFADAISNS